MTGERYGYKDALPAPRTDMRRGNRPPPTIHAPDRTSGRKARMTPGRPPSLIDGPRSRPFPYDLWRVLSRTSAPALRRVLQAMIGPAITPAQQEIIAGLPAPELCLILLSRAG